MHENNLRDYYTRVCINHIVLRIEPDIYGEHHIGCILDIAMNDEEVSMGLIV